MKVEDRVLDRIAQFVSRIVEGRDPGLSLHHKSVSELNIKMGVVLGLPADEINLLKVAGYIHDVGKMSINEHILYKPARLTATEWHLMKQHTTLGKHLLEPLRLAPEIIAAVESHHENYDGSGYPHGKSGDSIPVYARITRITDSFDALTTNRPYHRGVSNETAMSALLRDIQFFDRDLLEAFSEVVSGQLVDQPATDVASTAEMVS